MINQDYESLKESMGISDHSINTAEISDCNNNLMKTCTCEIKSSIKSFKNSENNELQTGINQQEDINRDKRTEINSYLKELDRQKLEFFKKHSNNTSLLQEKLNIINIEDENILKSLRKTWQEQSKQNKAIESINKLNLTEIRKQVIDNHLLEIDEKLISLKSSSGGTKSSNQSIMNKIQESIDSLSSLKKKLETEKRELSKDITKEKVKLKRNILGASFEDRKYLASLRVNKLNTSINIENFRLNKLSQEMESIKSNLNQNHTYNLPEKLLKNHLETIRQDYLSIKRSLRIDKTEENFWKKIEKLPVKQFNF